MGKIHAIIPLHKLSFHKAVALMGFYRVTRKAKRVALYPSENAYTKL